jgi:hypothetical protein
LLESTQKARYNHERVAHHGTLGFRHRKSIPCKGRPVSDKLEIETKTLVLIYAENESSNPRKCERQRPTVQHLVVWLGLLPEEHDILAW